MYQLPKEYKEDKSLLMGLIATVFVTALEKDVSLDEEVDTMLDMAGAAKHDVDSMTELFISYYKPEIVEYEELRSSLDDRIAKLAELDGVEPIKEEDVKPGKEYEVTGKAAELIKAIRDFQNSYASKLRILESIEIFSEKVIGHVMKDIVDADVALNKNEMTYHRLTEEEYVKSMFGM